jgi:hypothetical protein
MQAIVCAILPVLKTMLRIRISFDTHHLAGSRSTDSLRIRNFNHCFYQREYKFMIKLMAVLPIREILVQIWIRQIRNSD